MGACLSIVTNNNESMQQAVLLASPDNPDTTQRCKSLQRLNAICDSIVATQHAPLTEEQQNIFYRLYMEASNDSYDDIRKLGVVGISSLLRLKAIPTSKMDEVLEMVIDKAVDTVDGVIEASIILIGLMAKNQHIPSYSSTQILLLCMRKLDVANKAISLATVQTIHNMINGKLIPLSYTSKLFEVLLEKMGNNAMNYLHEQIIRMILALSVHYNIPLTYLNPTIELATNIIQSNNSEGSKGVAMHILSTIVDNMATNEISPDIGQNIVSIALELVSDIKTILKNYDVTLYSLHILAVSSDRKLIASNQVNEVYQPIASLLSSRIEKVVLNAIYCLSKFSQYDLIPEKYRNHLYESVMKKFEDQSGDIRAFAFAIISSLARSNNIQSNHLVNIINIAMKNGNDSHIGIRMNSILILSKMVNNRSVPYPTIYVDILNHSMILINDSEETIRYYSYVTITKLCEYNFIPNNSIDKLIDTFMGKLSTEISIKCRNSILSSILKLSQLKLIPSHQIFDLFTKILSFSTDDTPIIRLISLQTIQQLIKYEKLHKSMNHMTILFDLLLNHLSDMNDYVRSISMSIISNLIDYKIDFNQNYNNNNNANNNNNNANNNNIQVLLDVVIEASSDPFPSTKNNSLWILSKLCKNQTIPQEYYSIIHDLIVFKLKYESDVAARITVCYIVVYYSLFGSIHENLIVISLQTLISFKDHAIWKYRAIEGLCLFIEHDRFETGVEDGLLDILCEANNLGDEYYLLNMKESSRKKLSNEINDSIAKLSAYQSINAFHRRKNTVRPRRMSLNTLFTEAMNSTISNTMTTGQKVFESSQMAFGTDSIMLAINETISSSQKALLDNPIAAAISETISSSQKTISMGQDGVIAGQNVKNDSERSISSIDTSFASNIATQVLLPSIQLPYVPIMNTTTSQSSGPTTFRRRMTVDGMNLINTYSAAHTMISSTDQAIEGYIKLRDMILNPSIGLLPSEYLALVLNDLIEGTRSSSSQIQSISLEGVINLINQHKEISILSTEQLDSINQIILDRLEGSRNEIPCNLLNCLSILCQSNIFPNNKISSILSTLLYHVDHSDHHIRFYSLLTVSILAKQSMIPLANILQVLDALQEAIYDPEVNIQVIVMISMRYLVSYNAIPSSRMGILMEIVRLKAKDSNHELRANAQEALTLLMKNQSNEIGNKGNKMIEMNELNQTEESMQEFNLYESYEDFYEID